MNGIHIGEVLHAGVALVGTLAHRRRLCSSAGRCGAAAMDRATVEPGVELEYWVQRQRRAGGPAARRPVRRLVPAVDQRARARRAPSSAEPASRRLCRQQPRDRPGQHRAAGGAGARVDAPARHRARPRRRSFIRRQHRSAARAGCAAAGAFAGVARAGLAGEHHRRSHALDATVSDGVDHRKLARRRQAGRRRRLHAHGVGPGLSCSVRSGAAGRIRARPGRRGHLLRPGAAGDSAVATRARGRRAASGSPCSP